MRRSRSSRPGATRSCWAPRFPLVVSVVAPPRARAVPSVKVARRGKGPQGQGGPQGRGAPQGQGGPNAPNRAAGGPGGPGPNAGGSGGGGGGGNDASSPLKDAELPNMLKVTLDAERADAGNVPIKVIRLRYYAGMPQGVLVTGGDDNKQMVFNAQTGRAVSETEPGYPPAGFPFGWQAHQTRQRCASRWYHRPSRTVHGSLRWIVDVLSFHLRNLDLCRSLEAS